MTSRHQPLLILVVILIALFVAGSLQAQPMPLPLPRAAGDFVELQKLTHPGGVQEDSFGETVAINSDGSTLLIGAKGVANREGAAYIFIRTDSDAGSNAVWSLQQTLTVPTRQTGDEFGRSVALSDDGNVAVIGTSQSGIVYVFTRNGTVWTLADQLTETSAADDRYGTAVAINEDGSTIFVGANGEQTGYGAVYLYKRSGGLWVFAQKLMLPGNPFPAYAGFGYSIAVRGNTALISANDFYRSNEVFTYLYNGSTWNQQGQILQGEIEGEDDIYDFFGWSMALDDSGTTAIIGEWGSDQPALASGAAYIFVKSGVEWLLQQKIILAAGEPYDSFGWSVDLSGDGNKALISVLGDDNNRGSVYGYVRNGTTWEFRQQINGSDSIAPDTFGYSVALSQDGTMGLIGMRGDELMRGAAYVFSTTLLPNTATPVFTATAVPATATPITSTPDPLTPTLPAGTPTTLPSGTNLLSNASFEDKDTIGQSVLIPWKFTGDTKDKILCNSSTRLVAYNGECAFRFKGGEGENSRLRQKIDLNGLTLTTGSSLNLGFHAHVNGATTDVEVTLRVKYLDGTEKSESTLFIVQTDGYNAFTGGVTINSPAVKNMRVQIEHRSTDGKVWLDDLVLTVSP